MRPASAYQRSPSRQFAYHGRSFQAWRVPAYRYPRGYHYVRYYRGQVFPLSLLLGAYIINDYYSYGLTPPPPGAEWVRYGPDAVLVDQSGGQIDDTAAGVFDESLPADADGAPAGYDPSQAPPADDGQNGYEAGPPQPAPDLPPAFMDGRLELRSAAGCNAFYNDPSVRDRIDGAWQGEDWNEVVRTVSVSQCRSDLSYYLLAMSAEGLGLQAPAFHYYVTAMRFSNPRSPSAEVRCTAFQDGCRGIDIHAEALEGSRRTRP